MLDQRREDKRKTKLYIFLTPDNGISFISASLQIQKHQQGRMTGYGFLKINF